MFRFPVPDVFAEDPFIWSNHRRGIPCGQKVWVVIVLVHARVRLRNLNRTFRLLDPTTGDTGQFGGTEIIKGT